ncbi:MAG: 23S rRNA (guanosine(2251)-2'-O)-methyltransferase RlmB, partial [Spirochaetaceae bacterium]|nr:23S rRNA (guanosine(2251)-2'-O)-methyltransferase RlmB [Spirochaetaceae bacterium]
MRYLTGFHGITEAIKSDAGAMTLYVASTSGAPRPGPRVRDILALAEKQHLPIQTVDPIFLRKIDPDNKGLILEVQETHSALPASLDEILEDLPETAMALVLDHIEDPQNFGAIIRSADAFGVELIIVPTRRASPLTEAVVRASAGATAWVPVISVQNLNDSLHKLKDSGFWIF